MQRGVDGLTSLTYGYRMNLGGRRSVRFGVAALLGVLAAAFGCQNKEKPASVQTAPSVAAPPEAKPPKPSEKRGSDTELVVGSPAPDVTLKLEDGSQKRLSAYRGRALVLFFYPKDETSGCTIEAQGFRDKHDALTAANATVLGVSLQGADSHQAFIDKEKLPYHLVADTEGTVAQAFGVAVRGEYASRNTVLIDAAGKVAQVWRRVSPATHSQEVLAALGRLGTPSTK